MIKGLYSSASAMVTAAFRQQAISHDIANIDTAGFKQIFTSLTNFDDTSVYTQSSKVLSNSISYLGQLGLGVMSSEEFTDFSQGNLKNTESPLDLAIDGDGFFRIKTADGERYTRDGRFICDSNGLLTTVDGNLVLSDSGQSITLPDGEVSISTDGTISVENTTVAKIGLVVFSDPKTQLTREDQNTYSSSASPANKGGGLILQSTLEQSNVDVAKLITHMIEISRAYQASQKMVQNQDELLGKTISSLGQFG